MRGLPGWWLVLGLVVIGCREGPTKSPPPSAPGAPSQASRRWLSEEAYEARRGQAPGAASRVRLAAEARLPANTPRVTLSVARHHVDPVGNVNVILREQVDDVPLRYRDIGAIERTDGGIEVFRARDDVSRVRVPPAPGDTIKRAEAYLVQRGYQVVSSSAERWVEPRYGDELSPSGPDAGPPTNFVVGHAVSSWVLEPSGGKTLVEVFVHDEDGGVEERPIQDFAVNPVILKTAHSGTVTVLANKAPVNGKYALVDGWGNQVFYENPVDLQGTPYLSTSNTWGNGNESFTRGTGQEITPQGQTAAADAFVAMEVVQSLWQHVFQRHGYDDNYGPMHVIVHSSSLGSGAPNTWVLGKYTDHGYVDIGYEGYDQSLTEWLPATNIDVIGHEYGHAVYAAANLDRGGALGEAGGLNEGTGDIFGVLTRFHAPRVLSPVDGGSSRWDLTPSGDWKMHAGAGESSFADPQISVLPDDPTNEKREKLGTVLNHFFYFLSVGALPAGQPDIYPTPLEAPGRSSSKLPRGMPGIGVQAAAVYYYHTLTGSYVSGVNTFAGMRVAMLATVREIDQQDNTDAYKAVEDAFAAIGVGARADRDPPLVSLPSLYFQPSAPLLSIDASDSENSVARLEVLLDGQPLPALTGAPWGLALPWGLAEGPHALRITAYDNRGNSKTYDFQLIGDERKPTVSFVDVTASSSLAESTGGKYGAKRIVNLSTQDAISGIKSIRVLDNESKELSKEVFPKPYPNAVDRDAQVFDLTSATNGDHVLSVEVADAAGNIALVELPPFFRERTRPICVQQTVTVDPADQQRAKVEALATDYGSGIRDLVFQVKDLSGNWVSWSGVGQHNNAAERGVGFTRAAETQQLEPGNRTFRVQCTDSQQNSTTSREQSVLLKAPPCNTVVVAGGYLPSTAYFHMGKTAGTSTLTFQTFDIQDRIIVYTYPEGVQVADSTCISTPTGSGYVNPDPSVPSFAKTFTFNSPSTELKVVVTPNCDSTTASNTTLWNYKLSCPL